MLGLALRAAAEPTAAPSERAPAVRDFHRAWYSRKWNNPETANAHWAELLRGVDVSPMEFYDGVRAAIERRGIPESWLALVSIPEGGAFSPKRDYLRVGRGEHVVDICGAPFGDGFFVAYWLGPKPSGCLTLAFFFIPFFGLVYMRWVRPLTYYGVDASSMFLTAVHSALMEVIDGMTDASGARRLTELERKPIHRDFFGGR